MLPSPRPEWSPAWVTPSLAESTRGPNVTDFAEYAMKASRGFRAGEAVVFTDWQRWLVDRIFETTADGRLRYRRALVGLPRKQGKSLLGVAVALESLLWGQQGGQIFSAASDRAQARIVFGEARQQVLDNPALSKVVKVYRDALEYPKTGTVYRALSADAARAHGLAPSLVIADELHAWSSTASNSRGDELWAALTEGSADRPESMVLGITTAGSNSDSLLGRLYEYGKRNSQLDPEDPLFDPAFGFWWWEAPQDADPTDAEVWRMANPNLAEGLLDITDFEASISAAGSSGFAAFQRYRLNQWVRMAGEDFISPYHWEEARAEGSIPEGARIVAGFDGSVSGDATGLVGIDLDTGRMSVMAVWEPDPTDPEWTVDRHDVHGAVEKMFDRYDVQLLWADPSFYEPDVLEWSKRWRKRVERIPPTNQRMAPLAQQFLADVIAGDLTHDGDKRLTRHVLNAIATEAGSFRKEKKNSPRKIDLLACAVLANGARQAVAAKAKKPRRAVML